MTPILAPTPLCPLYIGYPRLRALSQSLTPQYPVYVAVVVEPEQGNLGQRIERYFVVASQPDPAHRVHYCRVPVTQIAFFHNAPFERDYPARMNEVSMVQTHTRTWLEARGYTVQEGFIAMPMGLVHLNAVGSDAEQGTGTDVGA